MCPETHPRDLSNTNGGVAAHNIPWHGCERMMIPQNGREMYTCMSRCLTWMGDLPYSQNSMVQTRRVNFLCTKSPPFSRSPHHHCPLCRLPVSSHPEFSSLPIFTAVPPSLSLSSSGLAAREEVSYPLILKFAHQTVWPGSEASIHQSHLGSLARSSLHALSPQTVSLQSCETSSRYFLWNSCALQSP